MKKLLVLASLAVALTACNQPTSTAPAVVAIENPNAIAKTTQAVVQAGVTAILAKNPTYSAEIVAVGDVLQTVAQSNPGVVNQATIAGALSKSNISAATQSEITAYLTSALTLFESNFQVQFPTLKVDYAIYLDAVSNGIYLATGNAGKVVALPVIPWPPVTPTPTPVGNLQPVTS
jgi:hypothetical protein